MPIISRGTELQTISEIVPGAIQGGNLTGLTNRGSGSPVVPPVTDADYGIIWISAVEGFIRNHSGNPITGYDLTNTNAVFSNVVALLYPGGASDDNDVQFEVPVPADMALDDPQITVILHFLIPEPPYTAVPIPGGLPTGCEGAFLMNISSVWTAIRFTVDNLGFIVTDNSGFPVVSEC